MKLTRYKSYFRINAPSSFVQALLLVFIGLLAGASAAIISKYPAMLSDYRFVVIGASIGVITISMPAFLTVLVIKAINRRMALKHALFSTLIIATFYLLAFLLLAAVFLISKSFLLANIVLLASNAGIYGYWLVMGKVVIRIRRSAAVFYAAIQPVLNVLFFIPFSFYLLGINFPITATLIKLVVSMLVFLVAAYAFLYFVDRPSKKLLGSSGLDVMSSMVSYWLYNISSDAKLVSKDVAHARHLEIDVISISNNAKISAVFVNPDIHFGPFANAGGSIAPRRLGELVAKRYDAAPFILHSTVNIEDNPVSASEVYDIANNVVKGIGGKAYPAVGSVSFGEHNGSRAIDINFGKVSLIVLTRAPHVTEDISRQVGIELKRFAEQILQKPVVLVDAHNSRYESAPKEELEGIPPGSRFVEDYKLAIKQAIEKERRRKLRIGFAHKRLRDLLGPQKDLGDAYTSVMVIDDSAQRFCLVYFDANNILPSFRQTVVEHISEKFGMKAELCTTDTHSINMLSEDASTVLGRYTPSQKVLPVLDLLIGSAIGNLSPSKCSYTHLQMANVRTWGPNVNQLLEETTRGIRTVVKRVLPFIVLASFVVAAWIIAVV